MGDSNHAVTTDAELVSIIIACYNQAQFVAEAIESVLSQSYSNLEIIVVDDGSTDNTAEVVARYPGTKCITQKNAGPSAARNAGVTASDGEYLVFLDADDRLLPDALAIGVECLRQQPPDCAFVWGFCRLIAVDGSLLSQPAQPYIDSDYYLELLRRNYIWCPGAVMHRRSAFESVNGFNETLGRGEDYDLFLRITRERPIFCHKQFVVDYRLHAATRSSDYSRMLQDLLSALDGQAEFVKGKQRHLEALGRGKAYWRERYQALQLAEQILPIVESNLSKEATIAVATAGNNQLLKLGGRRALHFPQAATASPGRLFQQGPAGSVEVPWIEANMRYDFRLFGGPDGSKEIAALSVIGVPEERFAPSIPPTSSDSAHLTASPNPVPAPNRFGRTTVSWNTGDGSEGRIYLSQGGTYDSSLPQDSRDAISRLETIRKCGAQYLMFPETAFWWLDQYQSFRHYLEAKYPPAMRHDNCCIIFDLQQRGNSGAEPACVSNTVVQPV